MGQIFAKTGIPFRKSTFIRLSSLYFKSDHGIFLHDYLDLTNLVLTTFLISVYFHAKIIKLFLHSFCGNPIII